MIRSLLLARGLFAGDGEAAPVAPPAAAAPAAAPPATPAAPAAPPAAAAPPVAPPAAAAPAAPAAPEKLDLKLPEKSTLDPSALETTTAIASELKLSPDGATKVLGLVDQVAAAHAAKAIADWQKSQTVGGADWERRNGEYKAAALKDPELGAGDPKKLEQAAALGTRALATWFPKDIIDTIRAAGLESHPGLLKGLVKLGRAMKEDEFIVAPPSASSGKTRAADVLYPTTAATPAS